MQEDIDVWTRQSARDMKTAQNCQAEGDFYAAALFCQQAAEKGLKAMIMSRTGKPAPKSHKLKLLGEMVGAPVEVLTALTAVDPAYLLARYPDATDRAEADRYSKGHSDSLITKTREVLEWIKSQMRESPSPST